jgi:hypothetical protein
VASSSTSGVDDKTFKPDDIDNLKDLRDVLVEIPSRKAVKIETSKEEERREDSHAVDVVDDKTESSSLSFPFLPLIINDFVTLWTNIMFRISAKYVFVSLLLLLSLKSQSKNLMVEKIRPSLTNNLRRLWTTRGDH